MGRSGKPVIIQGQSDMPFIHADIDLSILMRILKCFRPHVSSLTLFICYCALPH